MMDRQEKHRMIAGTVGALVFAFIIGFTIYAASTDETPAESETTPPAVFYTFTEDVPGYGTCTFAYASEDEGIEPKSAGLALVGCKEAT